jgi:hypothetical protein
MRFQSTMNNFQFLAKKDDVLQMSLFRFQYDKTPTALTIDPKYMLRLVMLPYRLLHTDPIYILCQVLEELRENYRSVTYAIQIIEIYSESKDTQNQLFVPIQSKKVKFFSTPRTFIDYWHYRHNIHQCTMLGNYHMLQLSPLSSYFK